MKVIYITNRMMVRIFGLQKSFRWVPVIALLSLLSCGKRPGPKTYFPETGRNSLYQRSLDLRNNLNVLSIAIRPGYEDLSALAYFRLGRGAKIMSGYVTNGEAGESDIQAELPAYLAAIRRKEASRALSYLDGEIYFLNMPDIAAARDTLKVRELWPRDTLQTRLIEMFSQFKPDIVLVARDWSSEGRNPVWEVMCSDVLAAVKRIVPGESKKTIPGTDAQQFWEINRVFVDDGKEKGFSIPVDRRHPRWKKTYHKIGEEAEKAYVSLAIQQRMWTEGEEPSYSLVYPVPLPRIDEMDAGLPKPSSMRLRGIEQKVERLTEATLRGKTGGAMDGLVDIMDAVNLCLVRRHEYNTRERRMLYNWKRILEDLRCTLLGVEVDYTISDTVLTARQLTFLRIDKVKGIKGKGDTDVYFPDAEKGWVIDEDMKKRLPLRLKEPYRVLTPKDVDYTFPPGQDRLQSSAVGKPFAFYIIHRDSSEEQSFVYRIQIELSLGPLDNLEILTPIVRMAPGEGVVFRVINLSRDGVSDKIWVENPLGSSEKIAFLLPEKGSSFLDTLFITWKGSRAAGTYLIPVLIDGLRAANFVARKFHAEVDASKKIGIVVGVKDDPIGNALRRLNVTFSKVGLDRTFSKQIEPMDVLIIGRRILTLKPKIVDFKEELDRFVNRGGHLIVLAQDAASWNTRPLWDGMRLERTVLFDENTPLQVDSTHTIFTSPNRIHPEDWNGWLFLRGYNDVFCSTLEDVQFPIRVRKEDLPLIVIQKEGNGRRTYVDLALGQQWMNIHPGAFRLLANLISY